MMTFSLEQSAFRENYDPELDEVFSQPRVPRNQAGCVFLSVNRESGEETFACAKKDGELVPFEFNPGLVWTDRVRVASGAYASVEFLVLNGAPQLSDYFTPDVEIAQFPDARACYDMMALHLREAFHNWFATGGEMGIIASLQNYPTLVATHPAPCDRRMRYEGALIRQILLGVPNAMLDDGHTEIRFSRLYPPKEPTLRGVLASVHTNFNAGKEENKFYIHLRAAHVARESQFSAFSHLSRILPDALESDGLSVVMPGGVSPPCYAVIPLTFSGVLVRRNAALENLIALCMRCGNAHRDWRADVDALLCHWMQWVFFTFIQQTSRWFRANANDDEWDLRKASAARGLRRTFKGVLMGDDIRVIGPPTTWEDWFLWNDVHTICGITRPGMAVNQEKFEYVCSTLLSFYDDLVVSAVYSGLTRALIQPCLRVGHSLTPKSVVAFDSRRSDAPITNQSLRRMCAKIVPSSVFPPSVEPGKMAADRPTPLRMPTVSNLEFLF